VYPEGSGRLGKGKKKYRSKGGGFDPAKEKDQAMDDARLNQGVGTLGKEKESRVEGEKQDLGK